MNYVGVDIHKEQSWFYVTDESGNKLDSKSISNKPDVLKKYFSGICNSDSNSRITSQEPSITDGFSVYAQ